MSLSWFGTVEKSPRIPDIRIPCRSVQRDPSNTHTFRRRLGFSGTTWSGSVSAAGRCHARNIASSRDSWCRCILLSLARGILYSRRDPGHCLVWSIPAHTGSTVQKSWSHLPRNILHHGQVSRHRTATPTSGAYQRRIRCMLVQFLGDLDFPLRRSALQLFDVSSLTVILSWLKLNFQVVHWLIWPHRGPGGAFRPSRRAVHRSTGSLDVLAYSNLLSSRLARR